MAEEIKLNDPNHLNPGAIPNNSLPVKEAPLEERGKRIEDYNNKPIIKNNDLELIDKNKDKKISKAKLDTLKVLSFFGVVAILVLAGSAAVFAYLAYHDGTLLESPATLICGNLTCEKQECTIPNIPDCNCGNIVCGNVSCPSYNLTCPIVNCNYNSS